MKRKGYHGVKRMRPTGAEIDLVVQHKSKKHFIAVEVKNQKNPVGPTVIKKLKMIVDKFGLIKEGIVVSKSGFTDEAKEQAKKSKIKIYKYAPRKKKKEPSLFGL